MSGAIPFIVNARPLLSPLTGIGRYVRCLMAEVEKDPGFVPHYFYTTHWARGLNQAPSASVGRGLVRMGRLVRLLDPLIRGLEQANFWAGAPKQAHAFYFEPAYLPHPSRAPTAITIHDLSHLRHPETHPPRRLQFLERGLPKAIEGAACILTVSEFTRREVIEVFGVAPERVVATPLGVESRFYPRQEQETRAYLQTLGLRHGHYFLVVGTIEPRKNLTLALHAHSRLPPAVRKTFPLVVAGMKGWLTGAISRRMESAQSRGELRLLGHVADVHLPLLYAGATMLTYPSIYEGFGLPPLEAMASGVPVAVSNRASLPEVVGDAGILLEPEDVEGLTATMLRSIEDAPFTLDLRERGLARASQFTWARCADISKAAWLDAIK